MVDELEPMLTRLKLTAVRDQLDAPLDQAGRAEMSLREALTTLCTPEVARGDERRLHRVRRAAFGGTQTDPRAGHIALGGQRRRRVAAGTAERRQELARARAEGRLKEELLHLTKPKLLVVDESGYLPFEANATHLFFHRVSHRNEREPMLVTGNRSVVEWGGVFGDAVVATTILDRLLHHRHVTTIRGDSHRLRTKRRRVPVVACVTSLPLLLVSTMRQRSGRRGRSCGSCELQAEAAEELPVNVVRSWPGP